MFKLLNKYVISTKSSFDKANKNNLFKKSFLGPNSCLKLLFTKRPISYLTWSKQLKHPHIAFFFSSKKSLVPNTPKIRNNMGPHTSPAFMVRNHVEEKGRKDRMVINYKKLNANTVFDGYCISNKTSSFQ